MRYLFDHPKKVSWRLPLATMPDGRQAVLDHSWVSIWDGELTIQAWRRERVAATGCACVLHPNAVFEGDLRVIGTVSHRQNPMFQVEDADFVGDKDWHMEVGVASMAEILVALQDGRLHVKDGWMHGRYTFAKNGPAVRVVPWDGPANGCTTWADAKGAPDMSAFIQSLK